MMTRRHEPSSVLRVHVLRKTSPHSNGSSCAPVWSHTLPLSSAAIVAEATTTTTSTMPPLPWRDIPSSSLRDLLLLLPSLPSPTQQLDVDEAFIVTCSCSSAAAAVNDSVASVHSTAMGARTTALQLVADALDFPEFWAYTIHLLIVASAAAYRRAPRHTAASLSLRAVTCQRTNRPSVFTLSLVFASSLPASSAALDGATLQWVEHRALLRAGLSPWPSPAWAATSPAGATLHGLGCVERVDREVLCADEFLALSTAKLMVQWTPNPEFPRVYPLVSIGCLQLCVTFPPPPPPTSHSTTHDDRDEALKRGRAVVASALNHLRGVELLVTRPATSLLVGDTTVSIRDFEWSVVTSNDAPCVVGVAALSGISVTEVGEHLIMAVLQPRSHACAFVEPVTADFAPFRVVARSDVESDAAPR